MSMWNDALLYQKSTINVMTHFINILLLFILNSNNRENKVKLILKILCELPLEISIVLIVMVNNIFVLGSNFANTFLSSFKELATSFTLAPPF